MEQTHTEPPVAEEPMTEEVAEQVAESDVPTQPDTDVTLRLAEDFLRLTEEFPDLQSPSQLPDGVLDTAAEENISLLDAYLRHRWQEEKKVLAAAAKREQAAQRSVGSLSAGSKQVAPAQDAFLRAFRRAL